MPSQHRYRLIGFRPSDELRERLQRIADDRGEALTEVVRRACWEYVEHYPGAEDDGASERDTRA